MKPFDAPANANTPPAAPPLWFSFPMAAGAAAIDIAAFQLSWWAKVHAAMHGAALDMRTTLWGIGAPAHAEDPSPVISQVAADMRAVGAAVLQAQIDTMQAFRHSA